MNGPPARGGEAGRRGRQRGGGQGFRRRTSYGGRSPGLVLPDQRVRNPGRLGRLGRRSRRGRRAEPLGRAEPAGGGQAGQGSGAEAVPAAGEHHRRRVGPGSARQRVLPGSRSHRLPVLRCGDPREGGRPAPPGRVRLGARPDVTVRPGGHRARGARGHLVADERGLHLGGHRRRVPGGLPAGSRDRQHSATPVRHMGCCQGFKEPGRLATCTGRPPVLADSVP